MVKKMKLENSPFTTKFLKRAYNEYKETGLFWGTLTILSSCFLLTKDKFLLMKFGSSGTGKTISDKIAIEAFGQHHRPLTISGRLTPAGMAKLMKKAESNPSARRDLEEFRQARLIFVEDLSRCTTHYLKLTSLQFLAGLTKTTELDDLTSDGGTFRGNLGNEPKKCMVAGTPSDWEEISASSVFNEFIDRRSLTAIVLMSPLEWQVREDLAKNTLTRQEDWQIILHWLDMVRSVDVTAYLGPMREIRIGPHRELLYNKLSVFKKYPENLLAMIDSLAEGHARLNGRDIVLPEDYEAIDKLFSRFFLLADMKKKELFLTEELVRSHGVLTLSELVYRLRRRARNEDLPELNVVEKTVLNYATSSKYITKFNKGHRNQQVLIILSDYLRNIFNTWHKEVLEMINNAS